MPTLDVTRSYADGSILLQSDLDAFLNDIETLLNTTKIDGDNIQDAAITEAKIGAFAVTTAKIGAGAVTTAKIAASAVTATEIAASTITNAKMAADSINTTQIVNSAVTTAKIADGAITQAKRATLSNSVSSSSGTFSTTNTSYTDVTNLSVTITTTNRPVFVGLISDGAITGTGGLATYNASALAGAKIRILRDMTTIYEYRLQMSAGVSWIIPCGSVWHIDTSPGSGSRTYKVQVLSVVGTTTTYVQDAKLIAFEL